MTRRLQGDTPLYHLPARISTSPLITLEEAAETLGESIPTAKRWWAWSRAWIFNEIKTAQRA